MQETYPLGKMWPSQNKQKLNNETFSEISKVVKRECNGQEMKVGAIFFFPFLN